ncbi:MAG: CDP-archaeol synthase [Deltaproteobacteria bacterium]|nr:CDP-archaeol synthase [Deltaproteobacteria bacterium]
MLIVIKVAAFLLWVNFLPPLANMIWGERFNRPIDGGRLWFDQHPIFGDHKTIRGVLVSLLGGTAVAPLLDVDLPVAAGAAGLAMAGDLLSSFIKRRPNLPSGENVIVLDQIFESLFPILFLKGFLSLSWLQVLFILLCFIPAAYLGSAFWNFVMFRQPLENYPRIVRSTTRLREWRACHTPLARWQTLLNLSSFLADEVFYAWFFKLTGLEEKGLKNGLDVRVVEHTFNFPDLPRSFDGFRILLLTDLHLDGLPDLTEKLADRIRDMKVDLCLFGGDIRMKTYGPMAPCLRQLRRLLPHVRSQHGIFGVLGNHDCIEMAVDLEESGLIMLINDSWEINSSGESIWLVGLDDPHYYRTDDSERACRGIPDQGFKIFLAHSPEAYKAAAHCKSRLYLCGHTHGGQICLPGRGPILTNSRAPRFTAVGRWQYREMTGYTSRGAGASGVPLRFNCPGEICLITLRRGTEHGK